MNFLVVLLFFGARISRAAPADPVLTPAAIGPGVDGQAFALATSASKVYVGGIFTEAWDLTVNGVAMWDKSGWHALNNGVVGPVQALAMSGSNTYVGGTFTKAGGVKANNVAIWDGLKWHAMGSGVTGDAVLAFEVMGSNVYVGGQFTEAGGKNISSLAMWDGLNWHGLGSGVNDEVAALAVVGSNLYVGGLFTKAGGKNASKVAMWDGSEWHALGIGVNDAVSALAVVGSNLYVGGQFTEAGGKNASKVAMWDGSEWHALGIGMSSSTSDEYDDSGDSFWVNALAVIGSNVYAGGKFSEAGGEEVHGVAMWDGSSWHALGSGVDGYEVNALGTIGSNVYAGGYFTAAGGTPVSNVALWDGREWSTFRAIPTAPSSPTSSGYTAPVVAAVVAAGIVAVVVVVSTIGSVFGSTQATGIVAAKGSVSCARQLMLTEADCSHFIDASLPDLDYYRRALFGGFCMWEGAAIWQILLFHYLRSSFFFQVFRTHIAFVVGRPSEILASILLLPSRFCHSIRPKIGAGLLDMDVMLGAMATLNSVCLRLALINYHVVPPTYGGHFSMSVLASSITFLLWLLVKRPYTSSPSTFWTEKRRYLTAVGTGFLFETISLVVMVTSPLSSKPDFGASTFGLVSDMFLSPLLFTLATLLLGAFMGARLLSIIYPEEATPEYPRFHLLRDLYDTDNIEKLNIDETYTPLTTDVETDENELQ